MKRIFTILAIFLSFALINKTYANNVWINDLRNLYLKGNCIIYGINIRTFAAKDIDGNGIINEKTGEEKGNFLNAIERLDELAQSGINTIDILPILPTSKIHAHGTAGSLYSPADFYKINPQLKAPKSSLSIEEEIEKFITECHKRQIRVIVSLSGSAAYDLYTTNPELFLKDTTQKPIAIPNKSDEYFLDGGNEFNINNSVYKLYCDYIKNMVSLGVDGIKISYPEQKTKIFWQKLIKEIRLTEPQFLFLADNQDKNINNQVKTISTNDLLDAGFDGYFGDYNLYRQWKTSHDLYKTLNKDINTAKKYNNIKKAAANFVTHEQISPIIENGVELSKMIIWLQATLPVNSYFIDGFMTGDNYMFPNANKKAQTSETDDLNYYVNRGKIDIYNFSRKPEGEFKDLKETFAVGNNVKKGISKYSSSKDKLETFRTNNSEVIAYGRDLGQIIVIFIGNLNFKKENTVSLCIKDIKSTNIIPITTSNLPDIKNDILKITLKPGEVYTGLVMRFQAD